MTAGEALALARQMQATKYALVFDDGSYRAPRFSEIHAICHALTAAEQQVAELQAWQVNAQADIDAVAGKLVAAAQERDAAREETARVTALLDAALPVMQAYARENPTHFWGLEQQDPNGVHAWLARHAALAPTPPQPAARTEEGL